VARKEHYQVAFRNLNTPRNHNFLRVSRVMHCLNACGLGHFVRPMLRAFYQEAFETGELVCCCDSLANFWLRVLGDDWNSPANVQEFPLAFPQPMVSTAASADPAQPASQARSTLATAQDEQSTEPAEEAHRSALPRGQV
jgi:hypothetical protein